MQNTVNQRNVYKSPLTSNCTHINIPRYCPVLTVHCWGKSTGTVVSENTGETFEIKEIPKQDNNIITPEIWNCAAQVHYNAIGNNGTYYIGQFTIYCDGRVEGAKSVCLGN